MSNPYQINWSAEESKAATMTIAQLIWAISDCLETIRIIQNNPGSMLDRCEGKYYDQISVYRAELKRRQR